jgi:hypothetical protein
MSEKSKLYKSRERWKQKAIDRGNSTRTQRKEIQRIKTERNQFKEEARAAQAKLATQRNQALVSIQNKTDLVYLVLLLFLSARIGFRAIARVLTVFSPYLGLPKAPCPQTVSNWVTRLSIAKMHTFAQPFGHTAMGVARKTVWLIDLSIGLGSGKILSVLSLNIEHHQQKNYAPKLADVQCIATAVADAWNGETIADFLRKVITNVGCPVAFLKDGGTDLEKAVGLLNAQGSSYQCIADISHKVANLFKHEYGEDPLFDTFISACGQVSRKLKQTLLACLAPPKVSTKARFMNLHRLVEWADKLLNHVSPGEGEEKPMQVKLRASLDQLPACESFIKRFLHDAKPLLACQKILKQTGLNLATYAQCQQLIEVIPASSSIRIGFTDWAKSQLVIANKLGLNQIGLPISTDVIESLFGVGKRFGTGQVKDANRIASRLPALCGTLTKQDAQDVIDITVAKHKEVIGCIDSLSKQRRDVLPNPGRLETLANDSDQHHLVFIPNPGLVSEPSHEAVVVSDLRDTTPYYLSTISLLPWQVLFGVTFHDEWRVQRVKSWGKI